jgi:hypothetical protein
VRLRFPARRNRNTAIGVQAALACALMPFAARSIQVQSNTVDDPAVAALCPIVYPDDQTPAGRGYHYTFFGNAFFINDQGYLLTVAHVLETFRDGGQPYILVNRVDAPPRMLKVTVIAKDLQHDVAILRATPNPFSAKFNVVFLTLASEPVVRGQSVLALSLHPQRLQDAHSFESPREDSSAGTVLAYDSTQLEKSGPASDVFLLSHPVVKGQSGSPVIAAGSRAVVGLVEGLWLRGVSLSAVKSAPLPGDTPGAAIPIRFAITLLEQQGITWHAGSPSTAASPATASPPETDRPKQ